MIVLTAMFDLAGLAGAGWFSDISLRRTSWLDLDQTRRLERSGEI